MPIFYIVPYTHTTQSLHFLLRYYIQWNIVATRAVTLDLPSRHFTHCALTGRHYVPLPLFLLGGGEEVMEETVTVSMVYIEPNAAEPTQDSTKNFTPRVETATVREKARDSAPRKPLRTEVRSVARQMQDFWGWSDFDIWEEKNLIIFFEQHVVTKECSWNFTVKK